MIVLRSLRKVAQIAAEAALDGIYVLRTNVDAQILDTADVIRSYKQLARVERAFRDMKSDDLQIRPIHHRLEERVRFWLALAEPICLPASARTVPLYLTDAGIGHRR